MTSDAIRCDAFKSATLRCVDALVKKIKQCPGTSKKTHGHLSYIDMSSRACMMYIYCIIKAGKLLRNPGHFEFPTKQQFGFILNSKLGPGRSLKKSKNYPQ